ncbi:alpha/beta fold hydrolase [Jannaschia seosinensis]|nr:alpha/beta hydrolase [Jannaschia seosinensis]
MRLRAVLWPRADACGTVLLMQGRTEYVEKYSDAARELADRGFASAAVDWRGQGLSPRPERDPRVGHVNNFRDFQRDVDAFVELCEAEDMPRPWILLGHSMGGMIGFRTLKRRPNLFSRAVFSAPMWGLPLAPHRRFLGWTVSAAASAIGLGESAAPRSGKVADPAAAPFEGNLLTTDPKMFAWMKRQITVHPQLALGGPSLAWVLAAFREMHRSAREAAPDLPCLTFLGDDEDIVDPDAIHVRMASWPQSTLEIVPGARHEVLMGDPEMRRRAFDRIAAFAG